MPLEPRRRYFHGAVPVSTLGMNEAAIHTDGVYYKPVETTPAATATLRLENTTDPQIVGVLSPGVWWGAAALVNHVAAGAITAEVELLESSPGASDGVVIIAAGSLASAAVLTTTANFAPTTKKHLLQVTLSGAASADPVLSLIVQPTVPEWQ